MNAPGPRSLRDRVRAQRAFSSGAWRDVAEVKALGAVEFEVEPGIVFSSRVYGGPRGWWAEVHAVEVGPLVVTWPRDVPSGEIGDPRKGP